MSIFQKLRRALALTGAALVFPWCLPAAAQTKIVVLHGLAADFLPAFVAKDEGQEMIARNPERARQIEAKYLGFPGPLFPSFRLEMQASDLEYFVKVGRELGLVRQNVDPSKLVLK